MKNFPTIKFSNEQCKPVTVLEKRVLLQNCLNHLTLKSDSLPELSKGFSTALYN